jgi:hypothetical protein
MGRISVFAAYQLFKFLAMNKLCLPPVFNSLWISYKDSHLNVSIINIECATYVDRVLDLFQLPYYMVADETDVLLNPKLNVFERGFTGLTSSANSMLRMVST